LIDYAWSFDISADCRDRVTSKSDPKPDWSKVNILTCTI